MMKKLVPKNSPEKGCVCACACAFIWIRENDCKWKKTENNNSTRLEI